MALMYEESFEEFKAKIEALMKNFDICMMICNKLKGHYTHQKNRFDEAKETFEEFDITESKFQLWLLQQSQFDQHKKGFLLFYQKCDEFRKNAIEKLKIQGEDLESEIAKSLKSSPSETSTGTSTMSKIELTLSNDSIKSKQYEETDRTSLLSSSSTSKMAAELDNLKTAKLQRLKLPSNDCKKIRKCGYCLESHQIYECESYLRKTSRGRYAVVTKLRLCRNCLRPGHQAIDCRNEKRCKKCNKKHHTSLHFTKNLTSARSTDRICNKTINSNLKSSITGQDCKSLNLSTVRILITDENGNCQSVEAIIDTASNKHKINKHKINQNSVHNQSKFVHEHKMKNKPKERDMESSESSNQLSHKRSKILSNNQVNHKKQRESNEHLISIAKKQECQLTTDSSLSTNEKPATMTKERKSTLAEILENERLKRLYNRQQCSSDMSSSESTSCASNMKASYAESVKNFESIVQSRWQSPVLMNKHVIKSNGLCGIDRHHSSVESVESSYAEQE